jgi:hypothetical protein
MQDLVRLTGLAAAPTATEFHVFCLLEDEAARLGVAASLEEAMSWVRERAFADGQPSAEDIASCAAAAAIEDQAWKGLAFALSDDCLMERTFAEERLVYLSWVLEEEPGLRLLVAWEAAAPLQNAAFGIFVPRP